MTSEVTGEQVQEHFWRSFGDVRDLVILNTVTQSTKPWVHVRVRTRPAEDSIRARPIQQRVQDFKPDGFHVVYMGAEHLPHVAGRAGAQRIVLDTALAPARTVHRIARAIRSAR